jgi:hypothetical protein
MAGELINSWPDVVTALSAAGFGGIILKIIESWLGRSKTKSQQDKQYRDELRSESSVLRGEVEQLKAKIKDSEAQFDKLREKYWGIYMEYRMFQIEVTNILVKNNIDPREILNPDAYPLSHATPDQFGKE